MVAEVIGTLGLTAAVDLPMKPLALNNPAYWCERAADARRMAEQLADATEQTILDIARSYDTLAALIEARVAP